MTLLARAAFVAALAFLLRPELARYAAERRLRDATDRFRAVLAHPGKQEEVRAALDRIAELASAAAADLPGDPRPRVLAASARLVSGRTREALDLYRDALAAGERAEIDLNLGRAHALAGNAPEAQVALRRALWISPALSAALPNPIAKKLLDDVARLENELRAGLLREPPGLPD